MSQGKARRPNGTFRPGVTGNPNGRPPSSKSPSSLAELVARKLNSGVNRRKLADKLLSLATAGNLGAAQMVLTLTSGQRNAIPSGPSPSREQQRQQLSRLTDDELQALRSLVEKAQGITPDPIRFLKGQEYYDLQRLRGLREAEELRARHDQPRGPRLLLPPSKDSILEIGPHARTTKVRTSKPQKEGKTK
jgi:hypothetical protein